MAKKLVRNPHIDFGQGILNLIEEIHKDLHLDFQNNEQLQIVSIQFNSLDVIANQETIVELVSFVKRVLPAVNSTHAVHHKRRRIPTKDQSCQTDNSVFNIYGSITSMDSLHNNSSLMFDRYSSMILAEERYILKIDFKSCPKILSRSPR